MIFPSIEFALFFPLVLTLSWLLMPHPRLWKPFVLVASYAFYMAASWKFGALLAVVTLGNQLAAGALARTTAQRPRKWIVALAVVLDLGVLGAFKYYGFFAQEINGVLGDFGLALSMPLVAIAIPLGVSFYVFQAISYVVDVYRGVIGRGSTIDVAIYLSFFPHVVAGPIVRAREFLPQLAKPRDPRDVVVGAAVVLIAVGLVKKVAIADTLAREVVDPVFAVPEAYAAPDVALAAYAYAVQIYCDFSGYTDIAIGVALLMGFVFPQNFRAPYRATSIRDFWRRWHITLSRYLRDFLYIPLGGNRGGRIATSRNLMATMVLGGLWHGAAWTFVLWGAIHGSVLVAEHQLGDRRRPPAWLGWLLTFHVVVLAWVFFRAGDMATATTFLGQLTVGGEATLVTLHVVAIVVAVIAAQLLPQEPLARLRLRVESLRPLPLGAGLAALVLLVAATVPAQGVPPFIYFQF
ncbi:MAG TPA: MBOAT family O-acyltransferase [Solirubrobacteraceae bacterium]|nr:MBOAT family O-acyltransferase [Solirubrobacteraceae bacterium]